MKINKNVLYILSCTALAILANIALFKGPIGISYTLLIVSFYLIFFIRFKTHSFSHKRISGLLIFVIGALSLSYFVYSNVVFNTLNYLLIPVLVLAHTTLIMAPGNMPWHSMKLPSAMKDKVSKTFSAGGSVIKLVSRRFKRNIGDAPYKTGKKVILGLMIAFPLLFIVINLLLMADIEFANLIFSIPNYILRIELRFSWDIIRIAGLAFFFFCFFYAVRKKLRSEEKVYYTSSIRGDWDAVTVSTVLISLNLIYVLFTAVQFQYFFSGTLQATGLNYADYARRGYFELIVVTLINYATLLMTLGFTKKSTSTFVKIQLTLLIFFSSIMLTSAFMRLMLYEQVFGYTYLRIFAHVSMVYLIVIFTFTLLKVWIQRLSLIRFSLMFSLLFYVGVNIIGIDDFIVAKNVERYEETGKIDVYYLGTLSYSAVPTLVELYEEEPDLEGLKQVLQQKERALKNDSWQSYNLSREHAKRSLKRININEHHVN